MVSLDSGNGRRRSGHGHRAGPDCMGLVGARCALKARCCILGMRSGAYCYLLNVEDPMDRLIACTSIRMAADFNPFAAATPVRLAMRLASGRQASWLSFRLAPQGQSHAQRLLPDHLRSLGAMQSTFAGRTAPSSDPFQRLMGPNIKGVLISYDQSSSLVTCSLLPRRGISFLCTCLGAPCVAYSVRLPSRSIHVQIVSLIEQSSIQLTPHVSK